MQTNQINRRLLAMGLIAFVIFVVISRATGGALGWVTAGIGLAIALVVVGIEIVRHRREP